ncbi:glycosyltransferase family 2 protein [Guptibacillus hwajinpoensis]|uniref:glycosyltransferase family 2 protein n=1 Tax=Guptibacillus hwajinpoensis TaxID=208199 RepID=UPI0024B3433F|nr:glycosyltransferase family 2 protein [Pseudalkalibacillus hwajinpoensis]
MKQHVIVFLPAHNEEHAIGEVIKQIPRSIHPSVQVSVLVIDDGSTDRTVEVAKKAGANYIYSFVNNQGLGAAVRKGLSYSVELGADIGVMLDADNEYPAWQLADLLEPLFKGEADYVMGSRFKGTIDGMRLHRRLGNYCFTFIQSLLLQRWIYDGQSGMRVFSRQAMEHGEIIHDYNYAQVITLNLVRKGFRVKEVPITYQVRSTGESYIKFKAYLTSVLPAILKEMMRPVHKVSIDYSAHKILPGHITSMVAEKSH